MANSAAGWPRSNDYFDPPITDDQVRQVQECINDALEISYAKIEALQKRIEQYEFYERLRTEGVPDDHRRN